VLERLSKADAVHPSTRLQAAGPVARFEDVVVFQTLLVYHDKKHCGIFLPSAPELRDTLTHVLSHFDNEEDEEDEEDEEEEEEEVQREVQRRLNQSAAERYAELEAAEALEAAYESGRDLRAGRFAVFDVRGNLLWRMTLPSLYCDEVGLTGEYYGNTAELWYDEYPRGCMSLHPRRKRDAVMLGAAGVGVSYQIDDPFPDDGEEDDDEEDDGLGPDDLDDEDDDFGEDDEEFGEEDIQYDSDGHPFYVDADGNYCD
jgi:hypothetical protein